MENMQARHGRLRRPRAELLGHQAGQSRPGRTDYTVFAPQQPESITPTPEDDPPVAARATRAASRARSRSVRAPSASSQPVRRPAATTEFDIATPPPTQSATATRATPDAVSADPAYRRKAGDPPFVQAKDRTNMQWVPQADTDQRRPGPGTYWMPYDWTNALEHGTFIETVYAFILAEKQDHKVMQDRDKNNTGDIILWHCRRMLASTNPSLLRIITSGNLARELFLRNPSIHNFVLGLTQRSPHTATIYVMEMVNEQTRLAATPNQLLAIAAIAEQFNWSPARQSDEIKSAKQKWERKFKKYRKEIVNGKGKNVAYPDTLRESELRSMLDALKARINDIPLAMRNTAEAMPMREVGYAGKGDGRIAAHQKQNSSNKLMVLFFYVAEELFTGAQKLVIKGHTVYCIWDENQASLAEILFSVLGWAYTKTGHGFSFTPAGLSNTSIWMDEWSWNFIGREAVYLTRLLERLEEDNRRSLAWAREHGAIEGANVPSAAEIAARIDDRIFLCDIEHKVAKSTKDDRDYHAYARRIVEDVIKRDGYDIASDVELPMSGYMETSPAQSPGKKSDDEDLWGITPERKRGSKSVEVDEQGDHDTTESSDTDGSDDVFGASAAEDVDDDPAALPYFGSRNVVRGRGGKAREVDDIVAGFANLSSTGNEYLTARPLHAPSDGLADGRDGWAPLPLTRIPNSRAQPSALASSGAFGGDVHVDGSSAAPTVRKPAQAKTLLLRGANDDDWNPFDIQRAVGESLQSATVVNNTAQPGDGAQGSSLRPLAQPSQSSLPVQTQGRSQQSAAPAMPSTLPSSPPLLPGHGLDVHIDDMDSVAQREYREAVELQQANRERNSDDILGDDEMQDTTTAQEFDESMEIDG
nr:hypothetical protein B0A51_02209 [Rachicladosporium sp. CCFEE 5018]